MRLRPVRSKLSRQSRSDLRIRQGKVRLLQAARLARWVTGPAVFKKAPLSSSLGLRLQHRVLVCAEGVQSHPRLEAGKLRNLAIAAAHFDGRLLSAQSPFSFWKLLGRPSRSRGFALGTEVRDGCVVPSYGGGLCLLSGALFRLAAELDWDIVERHGHTIATADAMQVDATVMWPQVDLRFAPKVGASVLRVRLKNGVLSVGAYGERGIRPVRVWREPLGEAQNSNERVSSRVLRACPDGEAEVLGLDHKEQSTTGMQRNCLTCQVEQCQARPAFLRVLK